MVPFNINGCDKAEPAEATAGCGAEAIRLIEVNRNLNSQICGYLRQQEELVALCVQARDAMKKAIVAFDLATDSGFCRDGSAYFATRDALEAIRKHFGE